MKRLIRLSSAFALSIGCIALLAGCGIGPLTRTSLSSEVAIQGHVHGGQQPVSGATIQLYAVGTTGDGSASSPLISPTVYTDSGGNFTITGDFTCPSSSALVYLVATGGNPGLGSGGSNPQLAMMTALGACGTLTPSTFIFVNELTTVAGAYAMAPYFSAIADIGSASVDAAQLQSAFTYATQLVNTSTGTTPGVNLPSGYATPVAQINTIADIVSTCINSPGGTANDGSPCGMLFSLTTIPGTPPPANTLSALALLARNPTLNTPALYALSPPSAPFQPQDSYQPTDFSVALTPTGSPTLSFSPSPVTFSSSAIGFSASPVNVTVTNTGTASAIFSNFSVTGTSAGDFSQISSCSILAPGASCSIQVTATPSALGNSSATLNVPSNATGSAQTLMLSETGTAPSAGPASASPSSLSFPVAGLLQDVTLTNTGTTTLHVGAIAPTSGFGVYSNTCNGALPAQSVCTISVYTSTMTGNATGTLTIVDDAAAGNQTVALSTPQSPNGFSLTTGINFGQVAVGQSATQNVTLSGTSGYADYIFSGQLSGTDPQDFSSPLYCDSGNTPAHCGFSVTFQPTAAGTRTAKIISTENPGGYIALAGTGYSASAGPSLGLAITSAYNDPFVTTTGTTTSETVTVTNTGNATLSPRVTLLSSSNAYFSQTNTCGTLNAGATCTVTITFTIGNATAATFPATLTVSDPTTGVSQALSAAITTQFDNYNSPAPLLFSTQAVGTTSAPKSITLSTYDGRALGYPSTVTITGAPVSGGVVFSSYGGTTTCLASSSSCTLSFVFSPTAANVYQNTVTVSNSVNYDNAGFLLEGTGLGSPVAMLSPTSITFAPRPVNSTSIPVPVTLSNTGTGALVVSSITVAGAANNNYTQTNNCSSVAVNSSCTINITFAPTASGTQGATLTILSNAPSSPDMVMITGSAN